MPAIKYRVTLTGEEVEQLESLLNKGKSAARKQTRASLLLKAAAGCQDREMMEALGVSAGWVGKIRQRGVEEGVDAAMEDRRRPGQLEDIIGDGEFGGCRDGRQAASGGKAKAKAE